MRLGDPDAKGRRTPLPIPGTEVVMPVDMIIKSVGQNLEETFIAGIPNITSRNGRVIVNADTLQTSNPQFFAGGDCINGGKEVVNAAADGKRAAQGIHAYLFPGTK
jgi:glutamate synthase (NADPH/NADH) small chain